ncbi:hypothetical protein BLOT_007140 [Blomia tropicalis]|nr:hypothetical protein BLOT_007140 [Blomia tropicalis]
MEEATMFKNKMSAIVGLHIYSTRLNERIMRFLSLLFGLVHLQQQLHRVLDDFVILCTPIISGMNRQLVVSHQIE